MCQEPLNRHQHFLAKWETQFRAHDDSKQNYGDPKITQELRKSGETIAQRTVGKYMREMGIRAQWIKPWTSTTRDSDFSSELHNILDEQFSPERPNTVWCTDITYIWTQNGFVYLNCVMDLFARKIIAWREATQNMQRCYSHKGYPYDNACIESFHSLIKRE